jgi:putative ABC transport system substrate-binding protein
MIPVGTGLMTFGVGRRQFISVLGGTALAWPLAARAQQAALPVIGYLHNGSPGVNPHLEAAFGEGLQQTGYTEGQNVAIDRRWAESHYDRLPALAADLVRRQVTVIVAAGSSQSALAAKTATRTIPIVFDTNDDPVKLGLVDSFNRPAGNATGVAFFTAALDGKRLELLHELVPKAVAIGVLINPVSPNAERVLPEIQEAARVAKLQLYVIEASSEHDIDAAFTTLADLRAEALLVSTDPSFTQSRNRLAALAARSAIPAIYGRREFVVAGGLASYGESLTEAYRQMGVYAGKILSGVKPADLPVMQLTKIELVINLKTAKALGLEIPPTFVARADEVIE